MSDNRPGLSYHEVLNEKHGSILSNGFDTAIKISSKGAILGYKRLTKQNTDCYAPFRYLKICNATDEKILAIVLNRNKEILIFMNKELIFSKRRGTWQHYPNDSLYKQISTSSHNPHSYIRTAMYLSSLDVSFSHGGGCIAVIEDDKLDYVKSNLIRKGDCFENAINLKATQLKALFETNVKELDNYFAQK